MISFDSDMTLRWACREGDYMMWARFQGLFSSPGYEYKIEDLWELRDGNFVTITNRQSDLPNWFDLYPTEASGSLAFWMQKRLKEGYVPRQPIDLPNLWRVFAGDRIVWVGPSRGGVRPEDGILELVNFKENALVFGEPEPFDFTGEFPAFGGFDRGEPTPEGKRLCLVGWNAIKRLGPPREGAIGDKWSIG